ncbi:MAG: hypothetical protein K6C10_10290 [Prevotella sp.]|nr:hypothetical protein [Prevotella sp.]
MKQKLLRIALTLFTLSYSILNGFALNYKPAIDAIKKRTKEGNITQEVTIIDIVIIIFIFVLLAYLLWKIFLRDFYDDFKNCKTKKDYVNYVKFVLKWVLAFCLGALLADIL